MFQGSSSSISSNCKNYHKSIRFDSDFEKLDRETKTCSTCNVHTIGRQSFLLPRKEEVDLDLIKYV